MAYPFDGFLPFWEYGYPKDTPPSLFLQSTTFDYIPVNCCFHTVPKQGQKGAQNMTITSQYAGLLNATAAVIMITSGLALLILWLIRKGKE